MRPWGRSRVLVPLVAVAAATAVGSVIGIVANRASGLTHWPWPFSVMYDHPWRWTAALIPVTVVLAVLTWLTTSTTDGRQEPVGGPASFVHAAIGTLNFYAGFDTPVTSEDGRQQLRGLPEFVAGPFHDREDVLPQLLADMSNPEIVFVQLRGAPGIGKTAVAAQVARRAPDEVQPFFLTVSGYPGVNAFSVLRCLAEAVTDPGQRRVLVRRVSAPEADFQSKVEDVLAQLGNRPVWLVLDDAQDLWTPDGKAYRDELLSSLFAVLGRSKRQRISVLLVSEKAVPISRIPVRHIVDGLDERALEGYLADLAADGLPRASELSATEVRKLTNGSPRATELLAAAQEPDLDPLQQGIMQALAAVGRPVALAVLAHLTGGDEAGVDVALAGLVSRRLVRRQDHLRYLPPAEAERLVDILGDETRTALRRRAAEFFEAAANDRTVTRLADLDDSFNAIDLYIEAGDAAHALGLIAELDRDHLQKWGQTDVLLPWLRTLAGQLEQMPDQVVNASLLARALAQQGKLDAAIERVTVAGAWNENGNKQVELLFDLAGYRVRNAQLLEAARICRYLINEIGPGHPAIPFARAGLALCETETGAFPQALATIGRAEAEIAQNKDETLSGRRLGVRLRLQRALIKLEMGDHDTAERLVFEAREQAGDDDEQVLEARCVDLAAQVSLLRGDADQARDLAQEAYDTGTRLGSPDLYSTAGATLAVAELRKRRPREALAVANVAARYGLKLYAADTLALRGVASLRCGDTGDRTRRDFLAAAQLAEQLRRSAPDSYLLHEARGLALAGLAVLDGGSDEREALRAYEKAMEITNLPGSRHRRWNVFQALIEGQPADVLSGLRALLK
jgi:tetratricopeptide (TPR) repeat protein